MDAGAQASSGFCEDETVKKPTVFTGYGFSEKWNNYLSFNTLGRASNNRLSLESLLRSAEIDDDLRSLLKIPSACSDEGIPSNQNENGRNKRSPVALAFAELTYYAELPVDRGGLNQDMYRAFTETFDIDPGGNEVWQQCENRFGSGKTTMEYCMEQANARIAHNASEATSPGSATQRSGASGLQADERQSAVVECSIDAADNLAAHRSKTLLYFSSNLLSSPTQYTKLLVDAVKRRYGGRRQLFNKWLQSRTGASSSRAFAGHSTEINQASVQVFVAEVDAGSLMQKSDGTHRPSGGIRKPSEKQNFFVNNTCTLREFSKEIFCLSECHSEALRMSSYPNADDQLADTHPQQEIDFVYFLVGSMCFSDNVELRRVVHEALCADAAAGNAQELYKKIRFDARKSAKTTLDVTLGDLPVEFGRRYLYSHGCGCEHNLIFTDAFLALPNDPFYPILKEASHGAGVVRLNESLSAIRNCFTCGTQPIRWAVTECDKLPFAQVGLCDDCFKTFCFDGLEGRATCNFKAVRVAS